MRPWGGGGSSPWPWGGWGDGGLTYPAPPLLCAKPGHPGGLAGQGAEGVGESRVETEESLPPPPHWGSGGVGSGMRRAGDHPPVDHRLSNRPSNTGHRPQGSLGGGGVCTTRGLRSDAVGETIGGGMHAPKKVVEGAGAGGERDKRAWHEPPSPSGPEEGERGLGREGAPMGLGALGMGGQRGGRPHGSSVGRGPDPGTPAGGHPVPPSAPPAAVAASPAAVGALPDAEGVAAPRAPRGHRFGVPTPARHPAMHPPKRPTEPEKSLVSSATAAPALCSCGCRSNPEAAVRSSPGGPTDIPNGCVARARRGEGALAATAPPTAAGESPTAAANGGGRVADGRRFVARPPSADRQTLPATRERPSVGLATRGHSTPPTAVERTACTGHCVVALG